MHRVPKETNSTPTRRGSTVRCRHEVSVCFWRCLHPKATARTGGRRSFTMCQRGFVGQQLPYYQVLRLSVVGQGKNFVATRYLQGKQWDCPTKSARRTHMCERKLRARRETSYYIEKCLVGSITSRLSIGTAQGSCLRFDSRLRQNALLFQPYLRRRLTEWGVDRSTYRFSYAKSCISQAFSRLYTKVASLSSTPIYQSNC